MDYFDSILRKTHRKAVMKRVIAVLSAVVLLFTINTTKKTADTLERIPTCGVEEHVHTDACFDVDGNLICGFVEHVHTDACYQERPKSVDTFEPPVEEYQIELSDVDQADNVLSASTEAGSEANAMSMDIDAPVEELGELELEDINGEDNIAVPSGETEALPESEESQGYIVGTQNPCYLSDIIADQGLNIAIDDVVEIGQAIENDDDPILFNFELVDGDIALYVKEDFERAELVITTEDALHVVELLFGIAPIEETGADAREAEVSAEEPADVALGDIDQEQAIEGEEREEGLAEATGDAVRDGDVEDDQLISEPTEDEAELLDEVAEDIQVEQDAGKDDETAEQADESTEEIADAEESADEQGDAVADEGIEENEQADGEVTEEAAENEQADEAQDEATEEEAESEKSDDSESEQADGEATEEEAEDEQSGESKGEQADGEATEEEAEDEQSDESKGEQADGEETEEQAENEKPDESRDEGTEDEKSDAADGEEVKEVPEDEQTDEAQGDETEAPDDGAQPVPPEVVYAYYEATIDLADVEVYPIALTDLMARATWLGVEETVPAADVEGAAAAEPVSEPAETEPAEADALEEDIPDEGTAEVVEAEAVDPVQSEAVFELDGEDTVEPEVPEIHESDAWALDYDASVLSVERDGDDYALSILNSFEQTTLTVDNGKQYRITLLNGAVPVLYPAAAYMASTEYVTVNVEAPEGAFPTGTIMEVADVDDEDTINGISDKVEEDFVKVERVHAVDITFLNADGEEIEPLLPISVVISIRKTEQDESTVVVHMDDDGNAEVIQETTQAEKTEEDEESVAFRSDTFSVYAVVVTKILETRFISAEGETYEITVTYAEDAAIPMGATLEVREIEGEAAHEYLEQAKEAVEQQIALARFFNIEIWDGDKKIEPEASVSVSVRLLDVQQEKETVPMVVHFAKAGLEVMEVNEADKTAGETELIFTTDEFSIYGVLAMKSAVEDVFGKIGKTTADNVAIHENHYTMSSKKATIPNKGTRVTLLGTANGILGGMISKWYQIEYTDEAGVVYTGYVEQDDIEIVNVVETEPVDYASFTAKLSYDAGVLPEGTALSFGEPTLNGSEWTEVLDLLNGLRKNKTYAIQEISWFDLSFIHENVEIEPNGAVHVNIAMKQPMAVAENESLWLIHFASSGVEVVDSARFSIENSSAVGVDFTVNSFSAFAIVKVIETTVITDSGETFRIRVSYGTEAGIPDDADLAVEEIIGVSELYNEYVLKTKKVLGENEEVTFARFFDIKIVKDGQEIQPVKPVDVKIELADELNKDVKAVHFGNEVELLDTALVDADSLNDAVEFKTNGFSIYGVVLTEIIRTDFVASDGNLYDVTVRYNDDAQIPEGSTLRVTEIEQGTKAYNKAYQLMFNEEPDGEAPMMAVDIAIIDPDGNEIEPKSAVAVDLTVKGLPDDEDAEEMQESIAIKHIKEVPGGVIVETVASGAEIVVSENIETSFVVDSFSQFNITWARNNSTRATIRVHYVDEDGNDLTGQQANTISTNTNSSQFYTFANYASQTIDGANYKEARLSSVSGNVVTRVTFSRETGWYTTYYYTRFYNGNSLVSENTTNATYDVYLIYENTNPGLIISKATTGAITPATASFTVSSTDGEYTRTFTYADMTNGKIKFEDAPVGKTYTVTESGGERNGYVLTTTYGSNVALTTSKPSGTLTVNNAYVNDPNVVKVYVYVAAYDQDGNQFKNNPEFLELLGISGDTVDGNGYFPVGEIYIDKSFFNGKTTNKWAALINSSSDWEAVLAALGELDTSTLIYDLGVDYSLNQGNNVGDYMDQAIGDINKGAGSQCTALFGWSGHSYGFADQSVEYHLDLRFQTNKVTFITGNNGIKSGASKDGTTVDVRAYIQGSAIQQPRNLVIPAGYRLVGYYNDPNFTTPWNKIGTPITQDEIAYIKITPQENVILYYKPVPAGGGTVSLDAEGLNPETGTPAGSTATANPGYTFVGWYADEECTQLLSTDATYVPTKASSERWIDGTTYYAKFKENTVTLTFVAEDHVDHLEMDDIPEGIVSYEFSEDQRTLTVVLDAASGDSVTVKGIAGDGYAIKEWTIDGRAGNLTTDDSLTTSKTDDPQATNGLWTDRTYRVWAEVLKTITVTKEVNIVGTLDADDADVTVYFALKDLSKDPAPWVYNSDGSIYTTSIQIVDGEPQGTAQFVDLPAGTYEVWEVANANADSLTPGSVIAEGIVVSRIQTWISDTDTGNDVVLTDDDPNGSIRVINTLNRAGEAMTFWANKKWFTEKNSYTDANAEANVNVPTGAWVDFTLYRVYADEHEDEVQTIRLDGTANAVGEEEAWAAAFRDLPTVDDDGQAVSYYVKETAMADMSAYDYYTTFNDTTYTNGGSISNVVAYGDVDVTKDIELPADISEADKQAFIDALTITISGPAEVAEGRRITRTFDKNSFTVTESAKTVTYGVTDQPVVVLTLKATAKDLPAGTYTVSESGYNDSSLAYRWDQLHSWIKADKLPESQSSLINTEQYGEVSIDVPVGVNVTEGNYTTMVKFLNSYVVQDIKATKVWDDLGLDNADHPSVSLTLFRTDGSGNKTSVSTQIIGANQTDDNLTLTWQNQPQAYTYSLEEASIKGYTLESITGDAAEGFIVTNKKAAVIKIVKTDQSGSPLAGATFSSDFFSESITTDISGEEDAQEAIILGSTNVSLGTYTLTETSPPSGYNSLEGPVTISVEQGEVAGDIIVKTTINGQTSAFAHAERVDIDNPVSEWIITIRNDAGVFLPATGGPGTTLFYVIGSLLTLLAAALLLRRKEL